MAVPRTPRPPIIVPKPMEKPFDPTEIERWVARLARAIRLERLERNFLGAGHRTDAVNGVANGNEGSVAQQR